VFPNLATHLRVLERITNQEGGMEAQLRLLAIRCAARGIR
jgi:hypothetical protein